MNSLRKLRNMSAILMMGALVLSSCDDDDDEEDTPPTNTVRIITGTETWPANEITALNGRVVVDNGATLIIEGGAIIKAASGQGTAASALIVARGGRIETSGSSAAAPIIFTSSADDIEVGQTAGTNLDRTDNQLWGGVIILGSAPISAEDGDTETNIEGLPAEAGYGLYGGDEPGDDSGVFEYVSIRHGGISIGEGNEINGLTLGGVGTGTTINNVEVYATLDDGIECFGGTVDIDNALVYYQGDDGIDLDMNYSGTISNFAVIHGDGIGTDESLEIDGPENDTYTDGLFTLDNGICRIEGTEDGSAADFKSGAQGNVNNVTFFSGGKEVKFRTRFTDACEFRSDAYSNLVDASPTLIFTESNMIAGVKVYDGDEDEENPTACPTQLEDAQTAAGEAVNLEGTGATINLDAVFGWTLAGEKGEL